MRARTVVWGGGRRARCDPRSVLYNYWEGAREYVVRGQKQESVHNTICGIMAASTQKTLFGRMTSKERRERGNISFGNMIIEKKTFFGSFCRTNEQTPNRRNGPLPSQSRSQHTLGPGSWVLRADSSSQRDPSSAASKQSAYIVKIKIHSSCCEIEYFVETHLLQAVCDTPIARITGCVCPH